MTSKSDGSQKIDFQSRANDCRGTSFVTDPSPIERDLVEQLGQVEDLVEQLGQVEDLVEQLGQVEDLVDGPGPGR